MHVVGPTATTAQARGLAAAQGPELAIVDIHPDPTISPIPAARIAPAILEIVAMRMVLPRLTFLGRSATAGYLPDVNDLFR